MGIIRYSLLWVMQELYHQPYFGEVAAFRRGPGVSRAENRKRSSCGVGLGFKV